MRLAMLFWLAFMVPHPSTNVGITLELVPNQIQFKYESGLQVSYPYTVNDCRTLTAMDHEYVVKMIDEQVCYVININSPAMFRSSTWMSVHGKTH